ncbi:hypothetical protein [Microbulbifer sp. THAF38]|uniref:hypothetical protein n=1 Tax=Microbulbifer sp. THAF38 TaxID=2587856 RepID=UPI001267CDD3|nr:hypothetical protein [Microbulbifer sp. THAF38]QFT55377.1 hypothetical protein FIU95_12505 [Microbulbifer sp. THAF38]
MKKILASFILGVAISGNACLALDDSESSVMKVGIYAADGKPPYGVFDVTASDGKVYREVILADGTFRSTARDGSVVKGVWEQRKNGIFCSKPFKAPRFRCKYEEVNSNGVWTSTEIDGGEISTIRRLDE